MTIHFVNGVSTTETTPFSLTEYSNKTSSAKIYTSIDVQMFALNTIRKIENGKRGKIEKKTERNQTKIYTHARARAQNECDDENNVTLCTQYLNGVYGKMHSTIQHYGQSEYKRVGVGVRVDFIRN